jgi:PEGA domain-containing protein
MAVALMASSSPSAAQVIVGGYPYPAYRYAARDAAIRFDVKPDKTAVYLDGYYAGVVDDFDSWYQRLYTSPGPHQITLFLEGYRTYTESVYLTFDNTFKLHHRMERLLGGEVSERPAAPAPAPQFQGAPLPGQGAPLPRGPYGRPGPPPPNYPPSPQAPPPPPPGSAPSEGQHGTLSLTVQPGDSEVLVDGNPWRVQSQDRQLIELPEGRHNIQVRKTGYVGYLTDVQIHAGQTTNLDVRLKTQP